MKRTFSTNGRLTAKQSLQAKQQQQVPPKPKPEWNDNLNENPHKISRAEQLQKKLNTKSKNEQAAKEELQAKYEQLKHGIIPKEYKPITQKGQKKFQANETFINNKDLKKEYENRSYASQASLIQKQLKDRGIIEQREISDEIYVKRETTEVKTTYAPISQQIQSKTSQAEESKKTNSNDYEQILGLINQTKKDLDPGQYSIQWQNQNEAAHQMQRIQSQVIGSSASIACSIQNPDQDNFDYLDYKENEQRLEKLRNQNMSLYSNFLVTDTQANQAQKGSNNNELDHYFQNLNTLLGQQNQPQPQFSVQSDYQITPIKHAQSTYSGIDSPKSLLPNYSELLGNLKLEDQFSQVQNQQQQQYYQPQYQQQQQQQQQKPFDYSRAPLNQDYEPQFNQSKQLLNPDQVLNGMSYPYSQPQQVQQQQPSSRQWITPQGYQQQPFPQQQYPLQQQQQTTKDFDDSEDKEMARMREMLLNTQQEIDKIISGTTNVTNIYNSSKQSLNQETSSSNIRGQQTVKEVTINSNPWLQQQSQSSYYQQENFNTLNNKTSSLQQVTDFDDDIKPRSYPFQQSQVKKVEVASMPFKNQALQQYYQDGGNSLSLRSNLQNPTMYV